MAYYHRKKGAAVFVWLWQWMNNFLQLVKSGRLSGLSHLGGLSGSNSSPGISCKLLFYLQYWEWCLCSCRKHEGSKEKRVKVEVLNSAAMDGSRDLVSATSYTSQTHSGFSILSWIWWIDGGCFFQIDCQETISGYSFLHNEANSSLVKPSFLWMGVCVYQIEFPRRKW